MSQICCKFEVKFLRTMKKIDLPIWNFLPNDFLRFASLQKIDTLPSLFRFVPFYKFCEFICLLFCFYSFVFTLSFLIFYLLFRFHRLSTTVKITDTACRATIVCALTYYFKFKPTYLTNKSLTVPQFAAVHFRSPRNI